MTEKYKYIEELLNRFLEGETGTEEEKELYAFFKNNDLPEHLARYRSAFAYFENGLTEDLKEEATAINPSTKKKSSIKLKLTTAMAAVLLVILSLPLFVEEERFNPHEGSYMIKNGVVSYDIDEIKAEFQSFEQEIISKEQEMYEIIDAYERKLSEYSEIKKEIQDAENRILSQFAL